MTIFWIVAVSMLIAAAAWLLRPLLRRSARDAVGDTNLSVYRAQLAELTAEHRAGTLDAAQLEAAQTALARRLALEVPDAPVTAPSAAKPPIAMALSLAVVLPAVVIGLYLKLGTPQGVGIGAKDAAVQREAGELTPERVDAMIQQIEDHLKRKPDDAQGWAVLARGYRGLGKLPQAVQAFSRAVELTPQDAQLKVDLADALSASAGGDLRGRPTQLLNEALALEPDNAPALALAGGAAMQAKDGATALKHWQRLLAMMPPNVEVRTQLEQRIAEARALATGASPSTAAKPATSAAQSNNAASPQSQDASATPARVRVSVSLAPGMAEKLAATDTLFIFARAAQGPKMPLAVIRAKPSELPKQFTLSDANAMSPQMALSKFDQVVIGARVSKSGSPMPQPGDLEGLSAPIQPRDASVEIVIDKLLP